MGRGLGGCPPFEIFSPENQAITLYVPTAKTKSNFLRMSSNRDRMNERVQFLTEGGLTLKNPKTQCELNKQKLRLYLFVRQANI